jgi:hypothetical protein
MYLYFSTDNNMKQYWPKTEAGENMDLKDVITMIIGEERNTELYKYYDGWDVGGGQNAGQQSWFFVGISEGLKHQIVSMFEKVQPRYLSVK